MKKDPLILVTHILECITLINTFTANLKMSDFLARKETQDAVIRRLEIIGEVANAMPADFKEKHNIIPWRKIAGMRNILIHEYLALTLI